MPRSSVKSCKSMVRVLVTVSCYAPRYSSYRVLTTCSCMSRHVNHWHGMAPGPARRPYPVPGPSPGRSDPDVDPYRARARTRTYVRTYVPYRTVTSRRSCKWPARPRGNWRRGPTICPAHREHAYLLRFGVPVV